MLSEPLAVVARVAAALDRLAVPYIVGGSLASSIYGKPRATQDVDLVADIRSAHVEAFCADLRAEFYVDAAMIRDAIARRASFNVLHLGTMFKADVFVLKDEPWAREEMQRARTHRFEIGGAEVALRFASPEDTLLHKLVWYQLGDEVSDRQWGDVVGLVQVQGALLDGAYLDRWAARLDVADLLRRARGA